MKDFKDYMYEQYVNEGLTDLLTKFWDWLTNSKNYRKYDMFNDEYDEKSKKKYISLNYSNSIKMVEFKTEKELNGTIDKTIDIDNPKIGFNKTYEYITKHKNTKSKTHNRKWKIIDDRYKWVGFVFNSTRLKEVFAIIAYTYDKESNSAEIYFYDILSVYLNEIDYEDFYNKLREIAKTVYISDKKFVNLLDSNGIELEQAKDKKGMWIL